MHYSIEIWVEGECVDSIESRGANYAPMQGEEVSFVGGSLSGLSRRWKVIGRRHLVADNMNTLQLDCMEIVKG